MKNTLLVAFLFSLKGATAQQDPVFNIPLTKEGVDYYVSRGARENRDVDALITFFREDLQSTVVLTKEQRDNVFLSLNSVCNIIDVGWEIGAFKSDLIAAGRHRMKMRLTFCSMDHLDYSFDIFVNGYTIDFKNAILRALRKNVSKKEVMNAFKSAKLSYAPNTISKDTLDLVLREIQTDSLAFSGVYKLLSSTDFTSLSSIAVFEENGNFYLVNLENRAFKDNWKYGQVIGTVEKTTSSKYYVGKYKGIYGIVEDMTLLFDDNIIEITFTNDNRKIKFIKTK